ncbi:hypothetical protein HYQ44_006110 [Verticillium longisporum]|nr:hypothetical protein HYQ44_006110 [Verticillium longisporum]
MSTIASPRDPSVGPLSRRISNQPLTPTGSARPSLDSARSATTSPRPSTPNTASIAPPPAKQRANRAALREYYNLKKQQQQAAAGAPPTLEVTQHSEVPASELDTADFDADAYVRRAVEGSSLAELLKLYTRVLGEVRALDAEKKALISHLLVVVVVLLLLVTVRLDDVALLGAAVPLARDDLAANEALAGVERAGARVATPAGRGLAQLVGGDLDRQVERLVAGRGGRVSGDARGAAARGAVRSP